MTSHFQPWENLRFIEKSRADAFEDLLRAVSPIKGFSRYVRIQTSMDSGSEWIEILDADMIKEIQEAIQKCEL